LGNLISNLSGTVDAALRTVGKSKRVQRGPKTSVKRNNVDDEDVDEQDQNSDSAANDNTNSPQIYNTRFKGVKRVKLGREIPDGFPYTPQWIRQGSLKKNVHASPQRSTNNSPSARLESDWNDGLSRTYPFHHHDTVKYLFR